MAGTIKSYYKYALFLLNKKIDTFKDICEKSIDFYYLRYYGVETKFGNVKLLGFPIIYKAPGSRIIIDSNVTLVSNIRHNLAGINHPVILATLQSSAIIHIGEGSGASGSVLCSVEKIEIGKHVALGANCKIFDTDFHPLLPYKRLTQKSINDAKSKPVFIEDNVWVGEGAMILKGVRVGFGAIIGTKSVVNKTVVSLTVCAGNPAVFIKKIANDFPT